MTVFRLNKTAVFASVFFIALALRLIFVFQWDMTPYGGEPILDAMVYDKWAQEIAKGHLLRDTAFYASPLYPYLLGLFYAIFGHSLLIPSLINTLLGAALAFVLSLFAFEVFGIEAALVTGLLTACDMPLIFYTAPVMKEPLALLLLAVFMLHAFRAIRQNRLRDYVWSGVFMGLCAMTRGNALLLVPAFLLFSFLKWRKPVKVTARNLALFVVAVCVCIAPATLHNYLASHDFVPINYAYGFNLYIGNSPNANGTNNYPPEVASDPLEEERATVWRAQQEFGRIPKPSEVSNFWRDRALDFIWHSPQKQFRLLSNKTLAFWNATEAFDNYDIGFIRDNFDTLISWPLVEFWLIVSLAAFGAVAAWREKRRDVAILTGFIVVYMISVLIFYVTDRYRLPILVFLLPLSGAALPFGRKLFLNRNFKRAGCSIVFALMVLGISLLPFPNLVDIRAFDWGTLSVIYADEGDDDNAMDAFHKGSAISEKNMGTQSYVAAANIEHKLGRDDEAERIYHVAMGAYPTHGVLYYNYGRFRALKGDIPGALVAMKKAEQLWPSFMLTYNALALIYERLGQPAEALEAVWRGLAIDPHDKLLLELLPKLEARKPQ